jgi:hypothetical protein
MSLRHLSWRDIDIRFPSACRTFGSTAPSTAVREFASTFHVSTVAAELITAIFLVAYILGVRFICATHVLC